jgi:hypothetical protein
MPAALAAILAAHAAFAQPRPSTPAMSCNEARTLVAASGAVVLGTGVHTYDRYVSSRNFCEMDEVLEPAWVPTTDTPQCPVGYRCRSSNLDLFR